MIRINLLGQARPKPAGKGVPVEATFRLLLLAAALGIAVIILTITYFRESRQLDEVNRRISDLQSERGRLQQVKSQVEQFERQKAVLQQRINVIETLQKNRAGGQELLTMVANTVVRSETVWLTSLGRKGNTLEFEGEAGSINAVANFLTQMKRTGYFDKVELKEAKENDIAKGTQTFLFTLSADIASSPPPETSPAGTPAPGPAKGRS